MHPGIENLRHTFAFSLTTFALLSAIAAISLFSRRCVQHIFLLWPENDQRQQAEEQRHSDALDHLPLAASPHCIATPGAKKPRSTRLQLAGMKAILEEVKIDP
jgi:hypothetical protein